MAQIGKIENSPAESPFLFGKSFVKFLPRLTKLPIVKREDDSDQSIDGQYQNTVVHCNIDHSRNKVGNSASKGGRQMNKRKGRINRETNKTHRSFSQYHVTNQDTRPSS